MSENELNREAILAMEPGPEMDALVAERVMGWRQHFRNTIHWVLEHEARSVGYGRPRAIFGEWQPSRDIIAAWEVVEKLMQRYHWRLSTPFEALDQHYAGLTPLGMTGWNGRPDILAGAVTMPLAICRAALLSALPSAVQGADARK